MLSLNSLAFAHPKQEANCTGCRTRDRTWAMGFKVPCATSTPSGNSNHPKRYSVREQKIPVCCVIKIRGSIVLCRSGGIGRRSGFKIRRGKLSCGFESHLRYQNSHSLLSRSLFRFITRFTTSLCSGLRRSLSKLPTISINWSLHNPQ